MRPRSASDSDSVSSSSSLHTSTSPSGEKTRYRPPTASLSAVTPFRKRPIYLSLLAICIGALIANVIFRLAVLRHGTIAYHDFRHYLSNQIASTPQSRPQDTRLLAGTKPLIVALVSFSLRSRTELLDCYLQQNLARNGGLIDRVIFTSDTDEYVELDWLKKTVSEVDGYNLLSTGYSQFDEVYEGLTEKLIPLYSADMIKGSLGKSWKLAESLSHVIKQPDGQPDPLWLFINSETIYLSPDMITSLVYTHQTQPAYSIVQANVVNQQTLSWVHSKLGTTKPYRPEGGNIQDRADLETPPDSPASDVFDELEEQLKKIGIEARAGLDPSWRASELPLWSTEHSTAFTTSPSSPLSPMLFGVPIDFEPPPGKHRWLPFDSRVYADSPSATADQLDFRQRPSLSTPITPSTFVSVGPGSWPWTLSAQQLYSFLEHLEEELTAHGDTRDLGQSASASKASPGTRGLARYYFPLWSYETEPISLSLFLISSADIRDATPAPYPFPYDADEAEVGRWVVRSEVIHTKLSGRGAIIDGHAIAARFAPSQAGNSATWMDDNGASALETTDLLDRFRAYGQAVGCRARYTNI